MSEPAPAKNSFIAAQRLTPMHGFTPATISRKRFNENTTSLAVTIGFILPTLTSVNKRLEKHLNEGDDVPLDELLEIFVDCGKESAKSYADRLARVACQTGFACILIESKSATANSMVYLWDLYPRLAQRYVGELLHVLRVPRFVATLLGPAPTAVDVDYLQGRASPINAFAASMQRNTIYLVADVVVDTVRTLADSKVKGEDKPVVIGKKILGRVTTTVCWASGAAVGRLVGGERGEYYGEYIGTLLAPSVVLEVFTLLDNVKKTRGKKKASGSHKSRSHSEKSAAPAPAAA